MKILRLAALLVLSFSLSGCLLTKIVTVPMRVVGAVISIIPAVGNTADGAIDKAADAVDMLPF